jgi:hypothetical protein
MPRLDVPDSGRARMSAARPDLSETAAPSDVNPGAGTGRSEYPTRPGRRGLASAIAIIAALGCLAGYILVHRGDGARSRVPPPTALTPTGVSASAQPEPTGGNRVVRPKRSARRNRVVHPKAASVAAVTSRLPSAAPAPTGTSLGLARSTVGSTTGPPVRQPQAPRVPRRTPRSGGDAGGSIVVQIGSG